MFWKKKTAKKRTVLFVDDDEIVLTSLQRGLLDESYTKLFAKSGEEALEVLQRAEVHVIVTDMYMHEMTGLDLLRTVRKDYPHIVGVVLSGYVHDAAIQTAIRQGEIFRSIRKPWKIGGVDFEAVVRKAVDRYTLQNQH
jgi:two-component system repressor protein LuxO